MKKITVSYSSPNDLIYIFRKEFLRIGAKTRSDYSHNRDKAIPSWEYIAKQVGASGWADLCDMAGVSVRHVDNSRNRNIIINSITQTDIKLKAIEDRYKESVIELHAQRKK